MKIEYLKARNIIALFSHVVSSTDPGMKQLYSMDPQTK